MKASLNLIGAILGVAGVVFVALRIFNYAGEIDAAGTGAGDYAALFLLVLLYGASNSLLAIGWWQTLLGLSVPVSRRWAVRTYAISQLAKYVPGNIFQFAGRQAIGVAAGLASKPLAKSTGIEILFLIIGGVLFAPLVLPLVVHWPGIAVISLVSFVVLSASALWFAWRLGGSRFVSAALCYVAFLAVSGGLFAATYSIAGGELIASTFPGIVGAYVVAWLIGLLTPGAPAGIGVREAMLLFLLSELAAPPIILLAVVMGRCVTVLGDLWFYLLGVLHARR